MDYQTFNGQPPPFGGFPSSAQAPPPPTLPPHAQFQQSNQPTQPFAYPAAAFPNNGGQAFPSPGGMGGHGPGSGSSNTTTTTTTAAAARPPPDPSSLRHAPPAMHHFSPAPYSHALPSPAHHQFAPNRQTASPSSTTGQPYAPPHLHQQQQQHQQPHHPHHSPVPSNGHHPQQQQQPPPPHMSQPKPAEPVQAQTPVKNVPPSPVSPVAQARNQDRVATLLEINSILIKEMCDLQSQGKAGQAGQPAEGKAEGDKPQPSKEYLDYIRRLQTNLAFLAQNAEKNHKPGQPIQPGPAIMSAPAGPPEIVKLYQKLGDLFPGWKGQAPQMKQSPGPQRINSNVSIASQPPNSAGLQSNWSQNAMANMQQAQAQAQAKVDP